MRSEEIVKGNEQGNVGVRSGIGTITISGSVGELESAVEPLDNLFKPAILGRYIIIVGKADHLGDIELHTPFSKLLTGQQVDGKPIGNKLKRLSRELPELVESHSHGQHTRSKVSSVGHLVTKNRLLYRIHDEPDVMPDFLDLDVCFIGGNVVGWIVIEGIYKRLYNDRGGFNIVGNRHMGDRNPMDIANRPSRHSGRKAEVDAVRQAKAEDVRREFPEVEARTAFRHGIRIHLEEVHSVFAVVVPQFESLRIPFLLQSLFVSQSIFGVKIEPTPIIGTDMNIELIPLMLQRQGSATVRASQIDVIMFTIQIESAVANLAKNLPPATGVIVEILVRSTTTVTDNTTWHRGATSRFHRRQRLTLEFQVLL